MGGVWKPENHYRKCQRERGMGKDGNGQRWWSWGACPEVGIVTSKSGLFLTTKTSSLTAAGTTGPLGATGDHSRGISLLTRASRLPVLDTSTHDTSRIMHTTHVGIGRHLFVCCTFFHLSLGARWRRWAARMRHCTETRWDDQPSVGRLG